MRLKLIIIMFGILFAVAVRADYDEAALQKLFTDKKQRAQIDALRSGQTISKELKKSDKVKVSGYVTRSDGKSVVWVNNNTLEGSVIGDVKVQHSNVGKNKKVGVTLNGTHVHLKPGETWSEDSGISDIIK